jgi:prepilin-type processing-associated H-X9-DG protein
MSEMHFMQVPGRRFSAWLLLIAVTTIAAWIEIPRLQTAAQETHCVANLKTIGLALKQYHAVHGCFPPAFTTDAQGNPMHSWRVLILPFAGEAALYGAYRLDEPWNGANNSRLTSRMPSFYECPAHARRGCSSYAVVVGPETAFPGARPTALSEFRDGPANTAVVVEIEGGAIPWMEPRDPKMPAPGGADHLGSVVFGRQSWDLLRQQGLADRDHHAKGPNFLFADGHVDSYQIYDGLLLRAFLTIGGSEVFCVEKL